MDESSLITDFLAENFENICGIAKKVYGKADAAIQVNLKTAYTEYLTNSRRKHSRAKSFFIRNQPVELYSYYVPTGIICGTKVIEVPNYKNLIEFTNRIGISGTGGSGKSVLMKHLFLDCIQEKTHIPISFLSNPLLLSIMLLTYGENAEIPSKLSIFYDQAFDALFRRHDAYKGAYSRDRLTKLDIQDFSKVFSVFCLQTYEKRLFKMPRSLCLEYIEKSIAVVGVDESPNDFLQDLLSAVCLMLEDGLEIAFSHRSFQEYFVALHISSAAPETQVKLIDRYWKSIASDNVMSLLKEINCDLFERALLIPKLDDFFIALKVGKSVGITHLLRYLKSTYSLIEYRDDGDVDIVFIYVSNNLDIHRSQYRLLQIAALDYSNFEWPQKHVLDIQCKNFKEKYFSDTESYKIQSLNLRSPMLAELNNFKSWHSLDFLNGAFKGLKALKSKHTQSSQSFETLLGIR